MLNSISGQNDRWAQIAAAQTSSAVPAIPSDGLAASSLSSVASGTMAITGITGSPMSGDMNSALMSFIGKPAVLGSAKQATAQTAQTVNASDPTVLSTSAQLLKDLQTLLSSLSSSPSAAVSSTVIPVDTANSTATGGTAQNRQQVADDLNGLGFTLAPQSSGAQSSPANEPRTGPQGPEPPTDNSEIANLGTASANQGDDSSATTADTLDGSGPDGLKAFMQQFAMAAYSSGYASGMESASTSSTTSVHA